MNEVWLITGIPGSGKSTVARRLGAGMDRAVHIEGDRLLDDWVISGKALPGGEGPADEVDRQIKLCIKNQCLLAKSYSEAGFVPLMDFVVPGRSDLDVYLGHLRDHTLYLVVLAPQVSVALFRDEERNEKTIGAKWAHFDSQMRTELRDVGLWVDTSELSLDDTIRVVLERKPEALL